MEIVLSNILPHAHLIALVSNIVQKLIFYINFILWLLPPFRQYKGGFLLYFSILAITEPVSYLLYFVLKIEPIYFYALSSLALLITALWYTKSLQSRIMIINIVLSSIGIILFFIFKDMRLILFLIAYLQLIIFLLFFVYTMKKLFYRNIMYSYLLFIVFYELTVTVKFFLWILNIKTGLFLFYLLNVVEVFICVYFIIFNFKTSPRWRPKL